MIYRYEDDLQSARLRTRWLVMDDIPLWSPFFHDADAHRFIYPGKVLSAEAVATDMISRQLLRYKEKRFGLQAILDKRSGGLLGLCGLLLQDVEGKPEIEVGYHLLPQHWGNGYATEAARIFIDYAFGHGIANSVISIIDAENFPSQAVAGRNGLRREREITGKAGEKLLICRVSDRK
jgi:[ribosomal protein S5]-alanine N-acetyltransferase